MAHLELQAQNGKHHAVHVWEYQLQLKQGAVSGTAHSDGSSEHQTSPGHKKGVFVHGDPGPFGLLCFGMTTCMLMFITTGWSEKTFLPTVFCYALFYGGAGQFVAGVLELIKGNTFGGTAFASYGAFWMGWFLLEYLTVMNPTIYHTAHTGKTLWCGLWAFLTAGFFVVTLNKNGCLMTIFSTLVITFSLLAGGMWSERCERAAGYFGFFCGASAIYAAFAFLYHEELNVQLPGVRPVKLIPEARKASQAAGDGGSGARGGGGAAAASSTDPRVVLSHARAAVALPAAEVGPLPSPAPTTARAPSFPTEAKAPSPAPASLGKVATVTAHSGTCLQA